MSYTGRDRMYRRSERSREEPVRTDAVTAALTAQVFICILLLIGVFIVKKTDEEGYARFRERYAEMLTNSAEMQAAVEWFSGFEGIFDVPRRLLDKFTGAPPSEAETDINEPEDEPEPVVELQYDYLDEMDNGYAPEDEGVYQSVYTGGAGSVPVYLGTRIRPPLTGVITSGFANRSHPVTNEEDFHTGIDVAAEEGRPISAALPGIVRETGWSDSYGNFIVLQHAPNLKTLYAHCSEIIAEEGMFVRQGERIALVGQTGVATGPHLHFSVIVDDEFTDPGLILSDYVKRVGG